MFFPAAIARVLGLMDLDDDLGSAPKTLEEWLAGSVPNQKRIQNTLGKVGGQSWPPKPRPHGRACRTDHRLLWSVAVGYARG